MAGVSRRVVFSCLCIFLGYSLFGLYALNLRFRLGFPMEAYWLSFVFVSTPLLCEVAFWKSDARALRLLYLLSFSLMMHLQYAVVDSSSLLSSEDAVADYRSTEKILAESRWKPFDSVQWGMGYEYRFYPVTNLIYATFSLLTGIPLLLVVKYLFVVKALAVTPLVERFFRSFFNQRVAYLATAVFLASPGAMLFPHKETFAVIFFVLGMYASTKTEKTREYLLVGLISVLTLTMTHHFTTYIFLFLLSSLFLSSRFQKRQEGFGVSGQFFLLCLVTFVAWIVYIASTIIAVHQRWIYDIFFGVLLPGRVIFSELLPLYTVYERIIVWLGLGIAAVAAVLGFLGYVRNRKSEHAHEEFSLRFFTMTVFLTPLLAVGSIFRFSPYRLNILISHRVFEFGYIAVGAFSALFFVWALKSRKKLSLDVVLICAIVFMIMAGPIAGAMHPRTFAKVSDVVSPKAISVNTWMSESGASSEYTIGDRMLYLVLAGYGNSLTFGYSEFFSSQGFNLPLDIRSEASYVATYTYMTDFYGPNAEKFYDSPYFHNLYTNGMLNVFRIANRTSS